MKLKIDETYPEKTGPVEAKIIHDGFGILDSEF